MKVHLIVDFSFFYYKYKFQLDNYKLKRLSVGNYDISYIYYPLREIELIQKNLKSSGNEVCMSICFDMKSSRKEKDEEYKANRESKLTDTDIANINEIFNIFKKIGYNVYREEGIEADDIIRELVVRYRDGFDYNVIYTPDTDVLVNIDEKVGVMRYKVGKGYIPISYNNFEKVLKEDLKCDIRYNNILLYKCTCGDKSDNIKGIKGFGVKSFDRLMEYIDKNVGVEYRSLSDYEKVEEVLGKCRGYLGDIQYEQAIASLELIKPIRVDIQKPEIDSNIDEMRSRIYLGYGMRSLV